MRGGTISEVYAVARERDFDEGGLAQTPPLCKSGGSEGLLMQRIQTALQSARMCKVLFLLDNGSHQYAEIVGEPQRRLHGAKEASCRREWFRRYETYGGNRRIGCLL